MNEDLNINDAKNKALSLYKYLKDLSALRIKTISDIKT